MKRLLMVFIIMMALLGTTGLAVQTESGPSENGFLRLHVIANSDAPADQKLKLEVKDRVVAMMKEDFQDLNDAWEARRVAIRERKQIEALAREVVTSQGYDYPVQVCIGEYDFPTKSYGNFVLPQGRYQAVRIILGEGQGENWWCVLFPPLCMVSTSDRGLSVATPEEAKVSFKCLELLPRGAGMHVSKK